jgi:hypothetical protein
MARTASKTRKSPKKKPVFIGVDVRSPGRRANNRYLVGREDALTKLFVYEMVESIARPEKSFMILAFMLKSDFRINSQKGR